MTPRPASRSGGSTRYRASRASRMAPLPTRCSRARPGQPGTASSGRAAAAARSGIRWPTTPKLDLLYIGTDNGSPWNRAVRSPGGGDNLFIASIIALRPDTGEYVWHFQESPGESWDFSATQHIVLADLQINDKPRQVLMQAPKNGFFYVLDRATGEFISARPIATVNWASAPRSAAPAGRWRTRKPATARPAKPWVSLPGPAGAHSWQPMSFSPVTRLVYIPATEAAFVFIAQTRIQTEGLRLEYRRRFQRRQSCPRIRRPSPGSSRG